MVEEGQVLTRSEVKAGEVEVQSPATQALWAAEEEAYPLPPHSELGNWYPSAEVAEVLLSERAAVVGRRVYAAL